MDESPPQPTVLSSMAPFSCLTVEFNRKLARTRWKRSKVPAATRFLAYLTLASALLSLACGEQRFVEEPQNVTVKHGESVTLPCKVADRRGTVQWTKDGFGLGADADLQGFSRYRMNVDEAAGKWRSGERVCDRWMMMWIREKGKG